MGTGEVCSSLKGQGYAVIPAVFSAEEIRATREMILGNLQLFKQTRAVDSARHLASFHRHPRLEPLHTKLSCNEQVLASMEAVFGEGAITIGLTDITINRSQQWHKDLLREKYAGFLEGIDVFDSQALAPVKALVYLQDSTSLKVLPGSHLHATELRQGDRALTDEWDKVASVSVQAGDVIFIDIRLTHAGSQEADFANKGLDDSAKILVSTVFAQDKSPLARAMERGNQQRFFDWQDRNEIYRVNQQHHLEKQEAPADVA